MKQKIKMDIKKLNLEKHIEDALIGAGIFTVKDFSHNINLLMENNILDNDDVADVQLAINKLD